LSFDISSFFFLSFFYFFFFIHPAPTLIYTLSLHDALPISHLERAPASPLQTSSFHPSLPPHPPGVTRPHPLGCARAVRAAISAPSRSLSRIEECPLSSRTRLVRSAGFARSFDGRTQPFGGPCRVERPVGGAGSAGGGTGLKEDRDRVFRTGVEVWEPRGMAAQGAAADTKASGGRNLRPPMASLAPPWIAGRDLSTGPSRTSTA